MKKLLTLRDLQYAYVAMKIWENHGMVCEDGPQTESTIECMLEGGYVGHYKDPDYKYVESVICGRSVSSILKAARILKAQGIPIPELDLLEEFE